MWSNRPTPVEQRLATHGVVSRAQLLSAGLSRRAIEHRLVRGRLYPIHRGVYAVGDPRLSRLGTWAAAILACGRGAALSHLSAAALWKLLPDQPGAVHVSVPRRAGQSRPRLVIHRSSTLTDQEVTIHQGIRVTTPQRTVIDISELLPQRRLARALDEADAAGLLGAGDIDAMLASAIGRRGQLALKQIATEHGLGSTLTRSELEERFLALCSESGLPRPRVNIRLEDMEVDFFWPRQGLVVETDGRRHHGTRDAFERDRARDQRLTAAGYRVVRFTYRQVLGETAVTVHMLRRLLCS